MKKTVSVAVLTCFLLIVTVVMALLSAALVLFPLDSGVLVELAPTPPPPPAILCPVV